jgi:hypothetical protein
LLQPLHKPFLYLRMLSNKLERLLVGDVA